MEGKIESGTRAWGGDQISFLSSQGHLSLAPISRYRKKLLTMELVPKREEAISNRSFFFFFWGGGGTILWYSLFIPWSPRVMIDKLDLGLVLIDPIMIGLSSDYRWLSMHKLSMNTISFAWLLNWSNPSVIDNTSHLWFMRHHDNRKMFQRMMNI